MKRETIKTEQIDSHIDGTSTTYKSEKIVEKSDSGLLEAWGFLLLIIFTLATTVLTYQFVSNIINRSNNNGIQIRQEDSRNLGISYH